MGDFHRSPSKVWWESDFSSPHFVKIVTHELKSPIIVEEEINENYNETTRSLPHDLQQNFAQENITLENSNSSQRARNCSESPNSHKSHDSGFSDSETSPPQIVENKSPKCAIRSLNCLNQTPKSHYSNESYTKSHSETNFKTESPKTVPEKKSEIDCELLAQNILKNNTAEILNKNFNISKEKYSPKKSIISQLNESIYHNNVKKSKSAPSTPKTSHKQYSLQSTNSDSKIKALQQYYANYNPQHANFRQERFETYKPPSKFYVYEPLLQNYRQIQLAPQQEKTPMQPISPKPFKSLQLPLKINSPSPKINPNSVKFRKIASLKNQTCSSCLEENEKAFRLPRARSRSVSPKLSRYLKVFDVYSDKNNSEQNCPSTISLGINEKHISNNVNTLPRNYKEKLNFSQNLQNDNFTVYHAQPVSVNEKSQEFSSLQYIPLNQITFSNEYSEENKNEHLEDGKNNITPNEILNKSYGNKNDQEEYVINYQEDNKVEISLTKPKVSRNLLNSYPTRTNLNKIKHSEGIDSRRISLKFLNEDYKNNNVTSSLEQFNFSQKEKIALNDKIEEITQNDKDWLMEPTENVNLRNTPKKLLDLNDYDSVIKKIEEICSPKKIDQNELNNNEYERISSDLKKEIQKEKIERCPKNQIFSSGYTTPDSQFATPSHNLTVIEQKSKNFKNFDKIGLSKSLNSLKQDFSPKCKNRLNITEPDRLTYNSNEISFENPENSPEDNIEECIQSSNQTLCMDSTQINIENITRPKITSTPKSYRLTGEMQNQIVVEINKRNQYNLKNAPAPVVKWLQDLEMLYEAECMVALQSKSICAELSRKVAQAAANATCTIKTLLNLSYEIYLDISNINGYLKKSENVSDINEFDAFARNLNKKITEFILAYIINNPKLNDDKLDPKTYNKTRCDKDIQEILELCEQLRNAEKMKNYDVELILNRLKLLFIDVEYSVLTLQIQILVNVIEDPTTELTLRGAVQGLLWLSLQHNSTINSIFVHCGVVRTLLYVCVENNASTIRAAALRALTTVCSNSKTIRQFEQAGGVEVLADIISEKYRPETELAEAVAVLAQITAPWIEDNCKVKDLKKHTKTFVKHITDLLENTKCCQVLLLCSAALANISSLELTSVWLLLHNKTAEKLIKAIQNRGTCISVFLKEQIATLIANISAEVESRLQLYEGNAVVALLYFLRAPISEKLSPAEYDATQRLQQKSAIALSRLCTNSKIAQQVVELGGVNQLVRLCKEKKERSNSDAVLVSSLATLRNITSNCGTCIMDGKDVMDLVEPKLVDSFSKYSGQNETYV